ncbi:hypothetical protein VaNZ11_000394 [Volvox africanus]|uniref:Uncharacterized protein n=1 Tax=Volvox africanus TaxID=51714 RepID=A0ABQ5RM35_9CHLO|nr:hypothetical protein VaNZ11_000394 [Volvox africanus]
MTGINNAMHASDLTDIDAAPVATVDGHQILISVVINGHRITISKRNLEQFDAQARAFAPRNAFLVTGQNLYAGFNTHSQELFSCHFQVPCICIRVAGIHFTCCSYSGIPVRLSNALSCPSPPQDPYFFDSDYTIAGSTGFLIWEANWLVLRLLRSTVSPSEMQRTGPLNPPPLLVPARHKPLFHLHHLLAGHRVLDLGSGTGLAGLSAAACGAHVLLTDLASVCEGTLRPNVQRNALPAAPGKASLINAALATSINTKTSGSVSTPVGTCMAFGDASADGAQCEDETGQQARRETTPGWFSGSWAGAVGVGQGSAAVMALDWTEPLEPQIWAGGNDPREADFILAVDTIWLLDIFHSFLDIVYAVLSHNPATGAAATTVIRPTPGVQPAGNERTNPVRRKRACFLAFVDRAGADSKLFVRKEAVEQELRNRGLDVDIVLAEDVDVDGVARPGRVLRVTMPN